ncbi:ammonium transporter [Gymnopus androsaceus JB14]|uniref:Ammonium transporter n=1 Tax=Gymnopus androsaceus JB14 TaxID=1447944 RepID=A0A6A4HX14_9AGAR|nr:ammonium transporter [Gymnopus androsaceus JB14]
MVNITYDSAGSIIYTDLSGAQTVYQNGDIAWILIGTAFVWIMIPGLGALSMMYMSMMTVAVVSFQWFFWGFSLAFSETGSPFIGDLKYFGMRGVDASPSIGSTRIPSLVFSVYQLVFAAATPMIALGAFAERGRLGPCAVFVFMWSTLVYDPVACWTWSSNGWSFVLGGLDFAGGSPVHITSGSAGLAISIYLGKRLLLWFGWFGFNGGSALSANLRAAMACTVTNLAASAGGITWMLWDYRLEKKWSAVGFCSGAIAGLVAITPGSGFVGAPASVLFGVAAGTICNFATQLKFIFGYDDTLDIFASHAIGGIVGNLLTGLFAQASVAAFDGFTVIPGGWLDHHYIQLAYQLADSTATLSYSFVMTTIILWLMHFFPFGILRLRGSEEAEIVGLDEFEMGEFAYDYVGLQQEIWHENKKQGGETLSGGREPEHHHQHRQIDLEKGHVE